MAIWGSKANTAKKARLKHAHLNTHTHLVQYVHTNPRLGLRVKIVESADLDGLCSRLCLPQRLRNTHHMLPSDWLHVTDWFEYPSPKTVSVWGSTEREWGCFEWMTELHFRTSTAAEENIILEAHFFFFIWQLGTKEILSKEILNCSGTKWTEWTEGRKKEEKHEAKSTNLTSPGFWFQ